MIVSRKSGKLGGETFTLQLKNAGLKMSFNPGYKLADDVKKAGDDAVEGIKSGKITVQP